MLEKQAKKKWYIDNSWIELAGKRVGFLGTGNISYETAKRLRAFDVDIWGVNTDGRDVDGFDRTFALGDSDEFFRSCEDRKSTRLNSSHANIWYAVLCLKRKNSMRGAT